MLKTEGYKNEIFFVGGAPRSGTTVLHALICTSARMCAYHPEISYVRPLFTAYAVGKNNWESHTKAFFSEREHFRLHICGVVNPVFDHMHRVLNRPELLCVKDPLLTPLFPVVHEVLGGRAKFLTVIRHPYDVVRSRQEVAFKANQEFSSPHVKKVAQEYMSCYKHLENPKLDSNLIYFRYEDLLLDEVQDRIKAFTGCDDISPDNVWAEKGPAQKTAPRPPSEEAAAKDPWFSPKYRSSIDLSSRLSPLDREFRLITSETCKPMMEQFGYDVDL